MERMTGTERLRTLAGAWNEWGLGGTLAEIADEIDRELREALGGNGRKPADYVSVSAYDLPPQEDRDAIAWVREHGGLDEVEAHWSGRVPLASVKRMVELHKAKRERLKAHVLGLERKCAERGETIRELSDRAAKQSDEIRVMRDVIAETCARLGVEGTGSTVDDAQVIWREISRRLMPEGFEWPRFEDGARLAFEDELPDFARTIYKTVKTVKFQADGTAALTNGGGSANVVVIVRPGERVKRPAPKVLDADGVNTSVGDTVYDVDTGEKMWVCALPEQGAYQCVKLRLINGMFKTLDPCRFTHQRPDSLDRLAEDIGAMVVAWRSNRDLFDAQEAAAGCVGENTLGAALDSLVRRARALAGDA